jgi:hypothetical protein
MKIVGSLLLLAGFAWLCYSAAIFPARVVDIASDGADSLPRRDTYSARELTEALVAVGSRIRSESPWVFTPACMMLLGGLLLYRHSTVRSEVRGDATI